MSPCTRLYGMKYCLADVQLTKIGCYSLHDKDTWPYFVLSSTCSNTGQKTWMKSFTLRLVYSFKEYLQSTQDEHGLPWWLGKELACNSGDLGLIPGWGRSPEGGQGNPLQSTCLEKSMDRGAQQTAVSGVAKSRTWLKDLAQMHTHIS